VATRALYLLRERPGAARERLEIQWEGLEAEVARIVEGRVANLVQSFAFDSADALRGFIRAEVERAFRRGFIAGVELPEAPPDLARAAERLERTAWFPLLEVGEGDPRGSRFGGRPWLAEAEAWPACGRCLLPMHFLVQLAGDDLPPALRPARPGALVQLFLCDRRCQKADLGTPFAPSTVARELHSERGGVARAPRPEVVFPAHRVLRWLPRPDHPSYADLCERLGLADALELVDALRARGLRPAGGEKLGGWPDWVEDAEYPRCPACRGPSRPRMEPWLQIDSNRSLPVQLGEHGVGWLIRCGGCGLLSFEWQSAVEQSSDRLREP
jgi:hypothetical protein